MSLREINRLLLSLMEKGTFDPEHPFGVDDRMDPRFFPKPLGPKDPDMRDKFSEVINSDSGRNQFWEFQKRYKFKAETIWFVYQIPPDEQDRYMRGKDLAEEYFPNMINLYADSRVKKRVQKFQLTIHDGNLRQVVGAMQDGLSRGAWFLIPKNSPVPETMPGPPVSYVIPHTEAWFFFYQQTVFSSALYLIHAESFNAYAKYEEKQGKRLVNADGIVDPDEIRRTVYLIQK